LPSDATVALLPSLWSAPEKEKKKSACGGGANEQCAAVRDRLQHVGTHSETIAWLQPHTNHQTATVTYLPPPTRITARFARTHQNPHPLHLLRRQHSCGRALCCVEGAWPRLTLLLHEAPDLRSWVCSRETGTPNARPETCESLAEPCLSGCTASIVVQGCVIAIVHVRVSVSV